MAGSDADLTDGFGDFRLCQLDRCLAFSIGDVHVATGHHQQFTDVDIAFFTCIMQS